ncbi:B-cell lymphoma/leukemia 10 [Bufo gargarizans]|uniref:B-cell lymphoma/leukemia 10 n=1 Tax=Bufo gargarizans TaxID=30331 RepID=UPI001CF3B2B6|nr:B-cell lymphoma/leukemia 10 [Bufo gargarizans]
MTPQLNEDVMADIKKEATERLRPYLCEKLIAERHFDYLRSKMILNKEDTEEILCQTTSRKRAGEMLDRLAKNPKGLDALIESIRQQRTQDFLIEKITDEVLRVKNSWLDSGKDCCLDHSPTSNGLSTADEKLASPQMESTILYHPEGEPSLPHCFSSSLTLRSPSTVENKSKNSNFSNKFPKPGELGAPPLPIIPPGEPVETCACSTIDSQFLPLRSSSPFNP